MTIVDAMPANTVAARYAITVFSKPYCARKTPATQTMNAATSDTCASAFALPRKIMKTPFAAKIEMKTAPADAKASIRRLTSEPPR